MYERHFGMQFPPFSNAPNPRLYVACPDHEEALATLMHAVRAGAGPVVVSGPPGVGKSFLLPVLRQRLHRAIRFVVINQPVEHADVLLELVCHGCGLNKTPDDAPAPILEQLLLEHLATAAQSGTKTILWVDQAELHGQEVLATLGRLAEAHHHTTSLLSLMLVGQHTVYDEMATEQTASLRQQLFRCVYLHPMSLSATQAYLSQRLALAGYAGSSLFDEEAVIAIHAMSGGAIRTINNLCDNACLTAYAMNQTNITRHHVSDAAAAMALSPVMQEPPEGRDTIPQPARPTVTRSLPETVSACAASHNVVVCEAAVARNLDVVADEMETPRANHVTDLYHSDGEEEQAGLASESHVVVDATPEEGVVGGDAAAWPTWRVEKLSDRLTSLQTERRIEVVGQSLKELLDQTRRAGRDGREGWLHLDHTLGRHPTAHKSS